MDNVEMNGRCIVIAASGADLSYIDINIARLI